VPPLEVDTRRCSCRRRPALVVAPPMAWWGALLEQVRLAVFDFDKTLTVEHAHRGYHLTGNSALHESLFGGRDRMGQLASMFVGESLCL
jgi:hypothetical protein